MTSFDTYLPASEWCTLAEKHSQTVRHWTVPCRRRHATGEKHPVYDFLFTYYPFSLGKLEQWHPGLNIALEATDRLPPTLRGKHYMQTQEHILLDPATLTEKQIQRIRWIHNLLVLTQSRSGNFGCNGMHEWAMVHSGADIRHRESAPLRLTQKETDYIVETLPIACSHFDAYRFFSPSAQHLNKLQPTLETREQNEQPACLHTNMDLYKWASKCMPWVGSKLLWKTFLLAMETRAIDMRASPYDLTKYGYTPIKIETPEGRVEYEKHQRSIAQKALTLRTNITVVLAYLLKNSRGN